MKSFDYKREIRRIVKNIIREQFPGIKASNLNKAASNISIAIHARFYGADVDDVASPIWRDDPKYYDLYENRQPNKTAQELLNDVE